MLWCLLLRLRSRWTNHLRFKVVFLTVRFTTLKNTFKALYEPGVDWLVVWHWDLSVWCLSWWLMLFYIVSKLLLTCISCRTYHHLWTIGMWWLTLSSILFDTLCLNIICKGAWHGRLFSRLKINFISNTQWIRLWCPILLVLKSSSIWVESSNRISTFYMLHAIWCHSLDRNIWVVATAASGLATSGSLVFLLLLLLRLLLLLARCL